MEKWSKRLGYLAALALFSCASVTRADSILGVDGGTGAPSATLGGYAMTPFGLDPTPYPPATPEDSIITPNGGILSFSKTQLHFQFGGNSAWGNGYHGDEYALQFGQGHPETLTITLPSDTVAFYLYALPDPNSSDTITATSGTANVSALVQGNANHAANYFGFYAATPNDRVTSVTLSSVNSDFLIGEFGIAQAAPLPSTAMTGGILLAGFGVYQLRRRRVCA